MEYRLCPSILSADFNRLGEQIQTLEKAGWRFCAEYFVWNAGDPFYPQRIQNVF